MKFSILALATSIMVTGSHAYIATFFSDPDCQGDSYSRNVYDNTCAAPTGAFQSFMLTTYGAGGQYMMWYSDAECTISGNIGCEGAQNGYPLNQCHNMNEPGQVAHAAGSFSTGC